MKNVAWKTSQNMGGAWGELKMLSKNSCEGVHLKKKLPASFEKNRKMGGVPPPPLIKI